MEQDFAKQISSERMILLDVGEEESVVAQSVCQQRSAPAMTFYVPTSVGGVDLKGSLEVDLSSCIISVLHGSSEARAATAADLVA